MKGRTPVVRVGCHMRERVYLSYIVIITIIVVTIMVIDIIIIVNMRAQKSSAQIHILEKVCPNSNLGSVPGGPILYFTNQMPEKYAIKWKRWDFL